MSSFFPIFSVPAGEAAAHPGVMHRMHQGEVAGILVRDVYTPQQCAELVGRLERGEHKVMRSSFPPPFKSHFLGANLNLLPPDMRPYFAAVPDFHRALSDLFAGLPDLRQHLASLFSALDGGRAYRAAPGPDGEHMFTTLRANLPGGFLPPHFDDEAAERPGYRYVKPQITGDLYSFVLAFSSAEEGGALEVFDYDRGSTSYRMVDGPGSAAELVAQARDSLQIRLQPGEMILFRSGRVLHRLTPVGGQRTRWTACSFMAQARDGSFLCWG